MGMFAALVSAACSSWGSSNEQTTALESQVCLQSDVPADFQQQTSGDFTPKNLADLGPKPDARLRQLEASGLRGGHFAYWKQAVGSPPFAAPLDLICQVLEFDSNAHAANFVAAIRPEPADLATTALTWLPNGSRTVIEKPAGLATARAFSISAEDSQALVEISAVVLADGHFVRTVYLGGNGRKGTIADAATIQERMSQRLK